MHIIDKNWLLLFFFIVQYIIENRLISVRPGEYALYSNDFSNEGLSSLFIVIGLIVLVLPFSMIYDVGRISIDDIVIPNMKGIVVSIILLIFIFSFDFISLYIKNIYSDIIAGILK